MKRSRKVIVKWIGSVAILAASTAAQAQVYYSAQRIGGDGTLGNRVNDRGQVVGQTAAGQAFVTGADGVGLTVLSPPKGQSNTAVDINNRGQVLVNLSSSAGPETSSYITGPNATGQIPLPVLPGGNFVTPRAINSNGQVTGRSGYQSLISGDTTPNFTYPFITGPDGKGMTNLGSLGGSTQSFGEAINNKGQVTGEYEPPQCPFCSFAFITGPNGVGMRELASQATGLNLAEDTCASSINAYGQIIGDYTFDVLQFGHGFLTGPNGVGVTYLPGFPFPYEYPEAYGLNDSGVVVGQAQPVDGDSGSLAFLYSQGKMKDLNSMIDPAHPLVAGTILTSANAISNTGKIVATGFNGTTSSAWLLTPCAKSNACGGNIFWRNSNGEVLVWYVSGGKVVSTENLGNPGTDWSIAGSGDFMGTGDSDIVWTDTSGDVMIWYISGGVLQSSVDFGKVSTSWSVAGVGDFNGDGKRDILWRNTNGNVEVWFMNGKAHTSSASLGSLPSSWTVQGTGDVNGDGNADIIWRNTQGDVVVWLMNGTSVGSTADLGHTPGAWTVSGVADFDGDGKADILWHDASNGETLIWFMNGGSISSSAHLRTIPTSWSIAATGDFNGNGKHDILWRNADGDTVVWDMNGAAISSSSNLDNMPAAQWSPVR
jgi:probable HAF family extracellular repeat protein